MKPFIFILLVTLAINVYAYDEVFYCTYQYDECVEFSEPIKIGKKDLGGLLERVAAGEKNFIGFIDPDGTTLQFFVDSVNDIWVEVPVPAEKGSYGKKINEAEFNAIIMELKFPYASYKLNLNLQYQAW